VRGNRPTDPDWAQALKPGWHRERMENFHAIASGVAQEEDLVSDGWTTPWAEAWAEIARSMPAEEMAAMGPQELRQLADLLIMEKVRGRVDEIVKDPATAQALKPYYNVMCKRPCFHDEYLDAFNLPNVTLVDTRGRGVEAIDGSSIIVEGKAYEVDLIVYSTGFEQNARTDRAGEFTLIGRGGATLAETWRDGMKTLHGILSPHFPNLFQVGGLSQSGGSVNFPFALSEQCTHVASVIKYCLDQDIVSMEVSQEAADGWARTIAEKALPLQDFLAQCTPGYFNQEGKVAGSFFLELYGGGLLEYFEILKNWRNEGFGKDMRIVHRAEA
jgi:cyclohexanone monooxygenase